jgi:AcrR family transcriptional regulator
LLAATADAVQDVGYARMTVAHVVGRARVSRKTFYDVFADREECFVAAFEYAFSRARRVAIEAYERESCWRDGIRSALARLLMLMDEEPALARLCVVETLAAGEKMMERRAQALEELAQAIDQGRSSTHAAREPPALTAEGIVGAILTVLHTRLRAEGKEPLTDLHGSLMSMIVLPYLGARAAGRELSRPPPNILRGKRPREPARSTEPVDALNTHLTYRTVRVLMVIAEHPGASNREIAESAGILDPGQISKLLTRLARRNLVENRGEGRQKGTVNAWQLTARGAQVERTTRRPR